MFDPDAEYEVHMDASDFAVGAALLLRASTGDLLPVEYFNHRLSAAEQNYCAAEYEFVAIIQALRRWRQYLIGRDVMVKTYHTSL